MRPLRYALGRVFHLGYVQGGGEIEVVASGTVETSV